MGHEDLKEMLAAHALDALEPAEARALEEHLRGCAGCRTDLARHRATTTHLAWDADPVTPPAHIRERLLTTLPARATPIRRATPRPLVVGGTIAAAAAIAAL
ncbi:MAG: zf-HC2 domain-containing protein, partial [Candidatus Binatia bacterium]